MGDGVIVYGDGTRTQNPSTSEIVRTLLRGESFVIFAMPKCDACEKIRNRCDQFDKGNPLGDYAIIMMYDTDALLSALEVARSGETKKFTNMDEFRFYRPFIIKVTKGKIGKVGVKKEEIFPPLSQSATESIGTSAYRVRRRRHKQRCVKCGHARVESSSTSGGVYSSSTSFDDKIMLDWHIPRHESVSV